MKKLFIILALVTSLIANNILALQASQFTDISTISDDLKSAVILLSNINIIQGYGDATFRPNMPISEQEWMRLLQRVKNLPELVTNYSSAPLTRIHALHLLENTWNFQVDALQQLASFTDIAEADKKLLGYFQHNNIIQGRGVDLFFPQAYLTRAEAAKILLLASNLIFPANDLFANENNATNNSVHITQNVVQIVDVSPRTLMPSGSGSLLFTVNNNGDPWTGLTHNADYIVSVLSGGVNIVSTQELGNGLYQVLFRAPSYVPSGPVNIRITLLHAGNYTTDINQFLNGQKTAQIDATRISLAQLLPSTVTAGDEAQILVTPRDSRARPVSGLDISAEITRGGGDIITPVVESPVGSGIYVGTYRARGQSGNRIEITVRINNLASRPQTIIYGVIW